MLLTKLVFMLRGIFSNWKIPIAFNFVRDGIKTFHLKKILKEPIAAIFKSGFILRCTVSDQGSANVAAINSLIADTREDILRSGNDDPNIFHYMIDKKKLYHMYDVPHLLKCFRNNFQKNDLLIGTQRAQWNYIEMVYASDGAQGRARTTKLTDKHIKPNIYDKMKKNDLLIGTQRAQWNYIEMVYASDGAQGRARTTKLTDKHIKPNTYDKMKKNDLLIGTQRAQWNYIEMVYASDGAQGRARTTKLTDKHIKPNTYDKMKKNDLLIGTQRAQWNYIEMVYASDGAQGRARTTKLTDKHIKPNSYDKMKERKATMKSGLINSMSQVKAL
ncbi:uncharacterized protein LOC123876354 isoform X1 [Maniola jurtina]|uniref:uncharacterized protein LOC123876354 isoform X1 n=3 Tax=Maniola jurtina TaxID=191418 RepID=UPI001E68AD03|nr:uncharacterized protein LOC123876354 isoform X1 [Maniola jurtina]